MYEQRNVFFPETLSTTSDYVSSSASDLTTTYENQHKGDTDASSDPRTNSTNTSPQAGVTAKTSVCVIFTMATILILFACFI